MIVIADYDPAWPARFAELRAGLAGALGPLAVAIEHVGSTAVPGLAAKPILDIDVVIETREQLPAAIAALAALGYFHQGDLGVSGREAFDQRGEPARHWPDHHLYVCDRNNPMLIAHLAFRDYLRGHPTLAQEYAALKRELTARHADNRDAYCEAKSAFVQRVLRLARGA